jgi:hypothetical protein
MTPCIPRELFHMVGRLVTGNTMPPRDPNDDHDDDDDDDDEDDEPDDEPAVIREPDE